MTAAVRRGLFITLDGPSAVGKSTTLHELADLLRGGDNMVHTTTEPSTSDLGQFIRANAAHLRGRALACLVAANRYEHIEAELRPHLRAGETVVCDRYLASTLVLQRLDEVPVPFLLALNADVLLPDLSVILTAEPTVVAERLARRGVRHRFHLDPAFPAREVALYAEAEQTLTAMGVRVLSLNTTNSTPTDVARRIADIVPTLTGSVSSHTRPDDHR
ncbi:dTMP kinase [Streptomyces sp. NPDC057617]|uniref:dTMP kinase n=1 Tax=Streptomyces sp. NPDC057617 TaxID=3346184 RepID=UPI003680D3FB